MVVLVHQQDIREEDVAGHPATPSVSSHQGFYHPQQLQHTKSQLTFDEWEAAIVKSMSERPDEIIDILERYAEEREQLSMREGDQEWGSEYDDGAEYDDGEEHTFDESRDPTEGTSQQRDALSTRDGCSNTRESFVAAFVAELRAKVARLTYPPSSLASMQSLSVSRHPEDEQRLEKLQADLDAEVLKSNGLALHLEESKHLYERQLQEMWDRIQWLEESKSHQLQPTADGEDESASKLEEASHMEMTQIVDDTTANGGRKRNSFILELQDKVLVLSKALMDMEQENVDLKEALAMMDQEKQSNGHNGNLGENHDSERTKELELELESTQNELYALQSRLKALDALVLRSERLLEMQGKKLEKSENALKKTRELYAYEKSARLSIERINDTTQVVMDKLHRKVEERRYEIDQLKNLLAQYNLEGHEIV